MYDFFKVSKRSPKKGITEIYPKFIVRKSSDLMIRGSSFYAIWLPEKNLWSTDEDDAIRAIDEEIDKYAEEERKKTDDLVIVLHLWDAETRMIDNWIRFTTKQMPDNFHLLDEEIIFSNTETTKKSYASKRLSYPLEGNDCPSYEKIISTLYDSNERRKIEWAIGSIISGDSKTNQKFMVLYGAAGTGKSTIIDIIELLFSGYCSVFDAKALGSSSNSFALEAFKSNPLVAIQHDGDLSRIEDNTRLNSLVSHELMTVNEKFKSTYANRFKCFLFMGTNKPVKITDGRSGLLRRLIDVTPSGRKIPQREYFTLKNRIQFELGAIAKHCLDVYLADPTYYNDYVPLSMMSSTNDFYNFMLEWYSVFKRESEVTLTEAYNRYTEYCDSANVEKKNRRIFKEELKNYFEDFQERVSVDGARIRSVYSGFKTDKFEKSKPKAKEEKKLLALDCTESIFDKTFADLPAQYANKDETPQYRWSSVKTKLSDINTGVVHYVRVPENHIVIDFDLKDENGNKSLERNLEAAAQWPETYAELSKSGKAVHLHYNYDGDVSELASLYDKDIEIKVFSGKSSLRRKLAKCNDKSIATLNTALPKKEKRRKTNVIDTNVLITDERITKEIVRNLKKEVHPSTASSVSMIAKILDDAYNSGITYDVSSLFQPVISFAMHSTHQADNCVKMVSKMHFKSKDLEEKESLQYQTVECDPSEEGEDKPIVIFDTEVYPNLVLICWMYLDDDEVHGIFNPTANDIEIFDHVRMVGYNCRRYDNHIMYGVKLGESAAESYDRSARIISGDTTALISNAYNYSYVDVYDMSSKKQSLKKFEIEYGIPHKEMYLDWNQPAPEDKWDEIALYCENDVRATKEVFLRRHADFTAREILAYLAKMPINTPTNTLTAKIIFGNNKNPQSAFNYRNLGDIEGGVNKVTISKDDVLFDQFGDDFTVFNNKNQPIFPGYKFEIAKIEDGEGFAKYTPKSTYRDEEVGEGGYVYAEPGMYTDVALLDIASMHPSSIIAEDLFGEEFTKRFAELKQARIEIKHKNFDKARTMLDGALSKFLDDESKSADLAQALKIAINAVYGMTSASFANPFKDPRNKDNIVAKRGALFMINLKHEVQNRGFTVAHIKTDSIKIPNATPEIIQFVMDYGKMYGYDFEHEATYDRMCLVNDAVYIAKYKGGEHDGEWTATGAQFAVPYVFKKCFSKEKIIFEDLTESKQVSSALWLDKNEGLPEGEHNYAFIGKVGSFCPMKPGYGGGILYRQTENKKTGEIGYAAATGTKGYIWLEAEEVKEKHLEDGIDISYYESLKNTAIETMSQYGDATWFMN